MPRDDKGVSFVRRTGFLNHSDGVFPSFEPPRRNPRTGTVWQDNSGTRSRAGVPSTRKGGRDLSQVPPLQAMPNKKVGAFASMPEDSKRSVHAFAMMNGTMDVHYKEEDGTHTALSPRAAHTMERQHPLLFASMRAEAAKQKKRKELSKPAFSDDQRFSTMDEEGDFW